MKHVCILKPAFFRVDEASKRLDKKKLAAFVARSPEIWRLLGRQTMQLPGFKPTSNLRAVIYFKSNPKMEQGVVISQLLKPKRLHNEKPSPRRFKVRS